MAASKTMWICVDSDGEFVRDAPNMKAAQEAGTEKGERWILVDEDFEFIRDLPAE